ncbi:MAG: sensor histidine kinase [Deltaproteobacteria bacterium]|nr:MAG: sensor histidine kinase [Deltaproteobacteria bacterium]
MKQRQKYVKRFIPVWVKLALYGSLGVVLVHSLHIVVGNTLATRALYELMNRQGRALARALVPRLAEALLTNDRLRAEEIVSGALVNSSVAWCAVYRGRRRWTTTRGEHEPSQLHHRAADDRETVIVAWHGHRFMEVAEPLLEGGAGLLRIGFRLDEVRDARRLLAMLLGSMAVVALVLGVVAAVLVAKNITVPVRAMLEATGRFDPADEPRRLGVASRDEIGILARHFEEMMIRLHEAHKERQQLQQRQIETERLAVLGTLAAGLAHEINNPLAGMKNCQRRLASGKLSEDKRDRYVELIGEGIERVEELVRRLLDFARPAPLEVEPVEVREILRRAAALVQPLFEKKRAVLREESSGGETVLRCDRHRMEQALVNLLLNALHVTEEGGEVVLSVASQGGEVVFSVADQGPGIPPQYRARVTDPFFTTKKPGEGTGLGLSVTQNIVRAHGGRLEFEFPSRGTVVRIRLPLGHGDRAVDAVESPAGSGPSDKA